MGIGRGVGGGDEGEVVRMADVALVLMRFVARDRRVEGVGDELVERPLGDGGFVFGRLVVLGWVGGWSVGSADGICRSIFRDAVFERWALLSV